MKCPQCLGTKYIRERRPDGDTSCMQRGCGYTSKSSYWDKFNLPYQLEEAVQTIDNLEVAHDAAAEERNTLQLILGEEKHYSEKLELEIEDLTRQLQYFAINVIEAYEDKLPPHERTYQKAVDFLKNRNKG